MSNRVHLFDLDDTLADTRAMRDGVARPIDVQMDRMSAGAALPLADHARALLAAGETVVILTARNDVPTTRAQIRRFGLSGVALHARPAGDNRQDHKVKREAVEALIAAGAEIVRSWDDKGSNVAMFRSFGIDTVQV